MHKGTEKGMTKALTGSGDVRLPRDFEWLWLSQTASCVADRITGFAVPSLAILVLNASGLEVGTLSALGWLAYPVLGMIAGAVLAHRRRKPVMVIGEIVRLAAFVSVPLMALAGSLTMTQLFIVVAVAGIATVFVDIAGQVYVPSFVGPNGLLAANSRLQASDSFSKLIGPAAAGFITSALGPIAGLTVDSLPFLVSAGGRARIRHTEVVPPREPGRGAILTQIKLGIGYVWQHPLLRRLVCGCAVRNFGMAIVDASLLLFAYRALSLSSTEVGLVLAAGAAGGLLGALVSSRVIRRLDVRATLLCTGLEGAMWVVVPLCLVFPSMPMLVVIRMFTSLWLPIWNATTTSLRQAVTPEHRHGSVQSTARTLMSSAVPLGSFVGGAACTVMTGVLGVSAGLIAVLATGGLCASFSAVVMRPATRKLSWRTLPSADAPGDTGVVVNGTSGAVEGR